MNSFAGQDVGLAELVLAEEQGLDLNRLLFVRYLVLTRRLTDDLQIEPQLALQAAR